MTAELQTTCGAAVRSSDLLGRVLVACEYSGAVRDAFRKLGWYAMSCDLLPTDAPGEHHQGDVRELLAQPWDIIIAFPPCTYLCSSGMHWTVRGLRDPKLTEDALDFVRCLLGADCKHIALENPVGAISTRIRKPDCIIHPWQFGHPESKTTCLWLKNLPALVPTNVLQKPASGRWENQCASGQNKLAPSPDRWKERSKTYPGIASAMAAQWSAFVLDSRTTAKPAPIAENLFVWSAGNTTPTENASALEMPRTTDGHSLNGVECSTVNATRPNDQAQRPPDSDSGAQPRESYMNKVSIAKRTGGSMQREVSCLWKHNKWHDYYDTQCGNALSLYTETPKENGYKYCPGCGGEIVYPQGEAANAKLTDRRD